MNKKIIKLGTMLLAITLLGTACSSNRSSKKETTVEEKTKVQENVMGESTKYPLEIDVLDEEGNVHKQKIDNVPEKVVTNNLSSTEMLLELGLQDKIVGMTNPDNKVTGKWTNEVEDINHIGDKTSVSKEIVAGLKPDILIGRSGFLNNEYIGSIDVLNDLGINVYTQKASNATENPKLSSIINDVKNLGEIFDVKERANEYTKELEDRYKIVLEKVEEAEGDEPLKTLVMVKFDSSVNTYSVFSMEFAGLQKDMLNALNLTPVVEKGGSNFTFENLVESNPDVILYVSADRNAKTDADAFDTLYSNEIIQNIPAVKNKKIIEVTYDGFMDYGARVFDSLEKVSEELYGK